MFGISSSGKEEIALAVEDIFDAIALSFIGPIPSLGHKKHLVITTQPDLGLAHLFVQSMANKSPNIFEVDAMKSLLRSSHGYIEALKSRTKSNVTERIDGLVKDANLKGTKVSNEEVQEVLRDEFEKARNHMITISEAESTKIRNAGSMMDISRVAADLQDEDPSVIFITVHDETTCKECKRLHLMPDGVTPRVWKFSELSNNYHKRGENNASAFGLHPHCRCVMAYLARGYGFDKTGHITYITENHNEWEKQNK